ncbi:N-acetyltransferase family protein [Brevibacillus fluminis]|uniref:GNAT family N-acetyltransferase n=1 Tax=Brevibacillus fluminis TaxID=511487 RepID=UPI003F89AA29
MSHPSLYTSRVLDAADAEHYVALRLEALRTNPEAFLVTYEESVADDNLLAVYRSRLMPTPLSFTMGAYRGEDLVGMATLIRSDREKIRHKASLVAVYTTPGERGKGVSKMLLSAMIEKAREWEGVEQITLTVASENVPAVKLYRSLGFEWFGTEKKAMLHQGVYADEDYMKLML